MAAAHRSLSEGMGVAAADAVADDVRSGAEVAGDEALHDACHFAGRGLAEAELRLIGGDGALGGAVDLLIEPGVFEAESAGRRAR